VVGEHDTFFGEVVEVTVQRDPARLELRQRADVEQGDVMVPGDLDVRPVGQLAQADLPDVPDRGADQRPRQRVRGLRRQPHLLPRPPGDGLAEPHPLRVGHVLDQAEQRRFRGNQTAPGLLLGQPVQAAVQRGPVLVEERLQLYLERFRGHLERRPPALHRHHGSIARAGHGFQRNSRGDPAE